MQEIDTMMILLNIISSLNVFQLVVSSPSESVEAWQAMLNRGSSETCRLFSHHATAEGLLGHLTV